MANEEHIGILRQGVKAWNDWRGSNQDIIPDLSGADLSGADLYRAYIREANLSGAKLRWVNLSWADLSWADLSGADLSGVDLWQASMIETNVKDAKFDSCHVYGIAVWALKGLPQSQRNIVITRPDEPDITVDDLEVAQFIHLLLEHEKLRNVINAVTHRGVLILGRFKDSGHELLQAIAQKIRDEKYLPIIFDFDRPDDRDYTETVQTLVGLSRFVVVDLSGSSIPQELYATVPHFNVPFVPILDVAKRSSSTVSDLFKYPWFLPPIVEFGSTEELIEMIPPRIISPAEERLKERQNAAR
ncbi:MAG: pentapeptide repeat-containing protein [Syntrophobacteraceae bacterium]